MRNLSNRKLLQINVIGWMLCIWLRISKIRYPWLTTMDKKDIKLLMQGLKDRMDYLTITGSLNQELTDPLY